MDGIKFGPRQTQVLQRILDGKSNGQIADDMGISPKTVDTYKEQIKQKMGVGAIRDVPLIVKNAEIEKLRQALTQLVLLKDLKDTYGETELYLEEKERAWNQARKALGREEGE